MTDTETSEMPAQNPQQSKGKYHEIFFPFPDVYTLGGTEVFSKFERKLSTSDESLSGSLQSYSGSEDRNLIVIPSQFIYRLGTKDRNGVTLPGAEDSVQIIKESQRYKIPSEDTSIDIRRIRNGLDIAILWDDSNLSTRDAFSHIEKKITDRWDIDRTDENPNGRPTFITNDQLEHIKLSSIDLVVQEPKFLQVDESIVRMGIINGPESLQSILHEKDGSVSLEEALDHFDSELYLNQFIRFNGNRMDFEFARILADIKKDENGSIVSVENQRVELLSKKDYAKDIRFEKRSSKEILGITPRDMEQYLAIQYGLLNPDVSIFFLCGSQGSGKTLLSYVASVLQILSDGEVPKGQSVGGVRYTHPGRYKQIVLLKSNDILGGDKREIGFLPGSMYDKIKPHISSYIDAHRESVLGKSFAFEEMFKHPKYETDFGKKRSDFASKTEIAGKYLPNNEAIELTYSGFMRGRSFSDTLFMIDEAQNFTPYELKTIIERSGEGSKIVIMGDPLQRDNPDCSSKINGLTHAIKQYLPRPYSALVSLGRNYRSEMSRDSSDWKVYRS